MKPIHALPALLAVGLALTGCTSNAAGDPPAIAPPPAPVAEPKTVEAAKAAAQREFDYYAAGDWGGTWDLWTKAGKAAFSREDYIRLHTTCKTITGPTFEITGARLEGDSKAVVNYKRLTFADTGTMVYEGAAWRWQPQPEDMKDYATGVDAMLKKRRAEGSCS